MAEAEKRKHYAPATGFTQADFARTIYEIITPADHTREEMEDPTYWVNHASRIRKNTRISVIADDYSYIGEGIVMAADKNSARVWFYNWVQREAVAVPTSERYRITQSAKGFRVIQKAGNRVVADGLPTMEVAVKKMVELEAAA